MIRKAIGETKAMAIMIARGTTENQVTAIMIVVVIIGNMLIHTMMATETIVIQGMDTMTVKDIGENNMVLYQQNKERR